SLATWGWARPLGAFLGDVAWRPDLALAGATLARRGATRALLFRFGFLVVAVAATEVSSGINLVISLLLWRLSFAVTAWITQVPLICKPNLHRSARGTEFPLRFPLACGAEPSVH